MSSSKTHKQFDWRDLAFCSFVAAAGGAVIYNIIANKQEFEQEMEDLKAAQHGNVSRTSFEKDFKIESLIGEGAFGKVYKVTYKLTEAQYAIKVIEGSLNQGSTEEDQNMTGIKVLEGLDHPNIVRYYNAWIEKQHGSACKFYIQMQYCSHGNLSEWMQLNNLQVRGASKALIWNQIVDAVQYIHEKELIHRDLKPENIFFESKDKIRVGDFGIVTRNAESFTVAGTTFYMSPEMFKGVAYNYKTDIYSAGVILFEMFSFFKSLSDRVDNLKNVRSNIFPSEFVENFKDVHQLVQAMLSEDPADRPTCLTHLQPDDVAKIDDEQD